jgi:NADH-quinone oxidoreductase subunit A
MQALPVQSLLSDYLPLVIFIGLSLVIGLALLIAPFAVAYSKPDAEKLSAYRMPALTPSTTRA